MNIPAYQQGAPVLLQQLNPQHIQATAGNIVQAVQVALSPNSGSDERVRATKFCNDFVQTASPQELCAVGFALAEHNDPMVTRSGLQFIEHAAKYHWQEIQQREEVKEKLFALMRNGLQQTAQYSGECPAYLQEAFAKVIVEIAKREWPQLWPNLFPQLFELASSSDLALLVIRRMVEDVATLQTVDCTERRRELSSSLTTIAGDVISTFYRVLVESVKQFQATNLSQYKRRAKTCMSCLLPYIEWNNPMTFISENRIPTLFLLTPEPDFQMEAVECLLQLAERKTLKKDDRFEIPKAYLENESFHPFIQAIYTADKNNYDFLRKLGELLIAISGNAALGKMNINNLILGIEKLSTRQEAVSVLGATASANVMIRSLEKESSSNTSVEMKYVDEQLTRLLSIIINKFVLSAPQPNEKSEMSRLKNEYANLLKTVGRRVPKFYNEVNAWLHNSLSSPNAVQSYQWEALILVLDSVASSVCHEDGDIVRIGLIDLEKCFEKFNSEETLEVKSLILSAVSALFVFLDLAKRRNEFSTAHMQLMMSIFDSVFKCFHLEGSPGCRDIRRHAASLLIKLATKFPDMVALAFDTIHSTALSLAPKISAMEYNGIMEALMLASNSWCDAVKQSAFIRTLINNAEWQEISTICDSLQTFTSILPENVFYEKRLLFIRNLSVVNSTLKRIKKTAKILQQNQNANNSGVAINGNGANDLDATHPAYDHVVPILSVVLKLVKCLHTLPESSELKFLMEMSEAEKSMVLGIHMGYGTASSFDKGAAALGELNPVDVEKSHAEKLRVFIQSILEMAYGILGESSYSLSPRFFQLPQVGDAFISFVGHNNQLLDDFRLRNVIRSVFKPFLLSCPISLAAGVVKPFAQKFLPFMAQRLVARWTVIENANVTDADGEEEKECVENSSLRILTKEYLEFLGRLLEKPTGKVSGTESKSGNEVMDSEMESGNIPNAPSGTEIGEVGLILLSDPVCFNAIVNAIVSALCWDDSVACLRATRCILMTWDFISQNLEVVKGTFATTLRAVCVWVESEANLDVLLRVLDNCFKNFYDKDPSIAQMLLEWGAPTTEIQKMIGFCLQNKQDKKRKDLFRKLVHSNPRLEKNKSPKSQWLTGLPQLHNDPKNAKQPPPEVDLNECFSLIHTPS